MPIKNVLIVDDSPTERHILTELLQRRRLRGKYRRKR
jgi:CheY-like chemotaxis protein